MNQFAILRGMRRRPTVFVLACAAAFALASPAEAQDDQVFVDPDSPTAHEYEIPLEQARRDASADQSAARPYRSREPPRCSERASGGGAPAAAGMSSG